MSETTRIPRERLKEYFDAFTKRFLRDGSPEAMDLELVGSELGDQFIAEGARLIGITYESRDNVLEFALDVGDHRIYDPEEVWVVEDADGFVSAIEVVHGDASREVINIKKVGLRRPV
jgi:hypothetical protein